MHSNDTMARPSVRSKRIWTAVVLGSLSGIGPLSIDMYLPALPSMAEELGTTASMTQLSLTACLIGLALGQLIVGPISDVKGRRIPLLIGIAAYALVSLLCVLSPNIWTVYRFKIFAGVCRGGGHCHRPGERPGYVFRRRADEVFCAADAD
jgi:Arabinose efflux permease